MEEFPKNNELLRFFSCRVNDIKFPHAVGLIFFKNRKHPLTLNYDIWKFIYGRISKTINELLIFFSRRVNDIKFPHAAGLIFFKNRKHPLTLN